VGVVGGKGQEGEGERVRESITGNGVGVVATVRGCELLADTLEAHKERGADDGILLWDTWA